VLGSSNRFAERRSTCARRSRGQFTLNRDGTEKTYNMGDSFTETPGQILQAFNRGSTQLIVAGTYLLPDGAQLTTNL
jgi:hypothetical protein